MAIQRTGSLPCRGQRDTPLSAAGGGAVTSAGSPVWDSAGTDEARAVLCYVPPAGVCLVSNTCNLRKSYLTSGGAPSTVPRAEECVGVVGGHVRPCSLCGSQSFGRGDRATEPHS